jgi:hypothetical protein
LTGWKACKPVLEYLDRSLLYRPEIALESVRRSFLELTVRGIEEIRRGTPGSGNGH